MSGSAAPRVVFAPDLIGGALFHPECQLVLERWRDGALLPVVSRELLHRYLKLLDALGLPPRLLKKWALWLTSPERSLFIEETPALGIGTTDLVFQTASAGAAEVIIYNEIKGANSATVPLMISAKEFLRSS